MTVENGIRLPHCLQILIQCGCRRIRLGVRKLKLLCIGKGNAVDCQTLPALGNHGFRLYRNRGLYQEFFLFYTAQCQIVQPYVPFVVRIFAYQEKQKFPRLLPHRILLVTDQRQVYQSQPIHLFERRLIYIDTLIPENIVGKCSHRQFSRSHGLRIIIEVKIQYLIGRKVNAFLLLQTDACLAETVIDIGGIVQGKPQHPLFAVILTASLPLIAVSRPAVVIDPSLGSVFKIPYSCSFFFLCPRRSKGRDSRGGRSCQNCRQHCGNLS